MIEHLFPSSHILPGSIPKSFFYLVFSLHIVFRSSCHVPNTHHRNCHFLVSSKARSYLTHMCSYSYHQLLERLVHQCLYQDSASNCSSLLPITYHLMPYSLDLTCLFVAGFCSHQFGSVELSNSHYCPVAYVFVEPRQFYFLSLYSMKVHYSSL